MNGRVQRWAETARARVEGCTWRDRWAANHPAAQMPLPLMDKAWPHVGDDARALMSWPSYRWPLNSARWFMAHLWPTRCDGSRRPWRQRMARAVWSVATAVVGVTALLVAAVLTLASTVLYVAGNACGFGLIVAGGWMAHRPQRWRLDGLDLDAWPGDVDPDLQEPPVPDISGQPVSGTDSSDFNNAGDAVLRAQVDATAAQRELITHQRQVMAHETQMSQTRTQVPPSPPPAGQSPAVARQRGPRSAAVALAKFAFVASMILGPLFFGTAMVLSLFVEPPTYTEIQTGIDERSEQRQAAIRSDWLEQVGP